MEKPLTDQALAPIDPVRRALAEAQSIPEFRDVRDMATAAKAWARARGLGIGAENEATEYILRAERGIGQTVESLRKAGGLLRPGQRKVVTSIFLAEPIPNARAEGLLSLSDIGVTESEAHRFRGLAALSDVTFEALLADAKAHTNMRLAKVNFYRAAPTGKTFERVTPEDKDFGKFRDGAYALLGIEPDDEGDLRPTRNGLLQLPGDELAVVRDIVAYMVTAYNDAREARRG